MGYPLSNRTISSETEALPVAVQAAIDKSFPHVSGLSDLFIKDVWQPLDIIPLLPEKPGVSSRGQKRLRYLSMQAARLNGGRSGKDTLPDMQICVPLAIARDDIVDSALSMLSTVAEANNGELRPAVLVWANAASREKTVAQAHYEQLCKKLGGFTTEFEIQTALTVTKTDTPAMTRVRHDMMAALTHDLLDVPNAYHLPVVWLDDDVTYLESGALSAMRQALATKHTAPFQHFETDYSTEWAQDECDLATKALKVHELVRRKERDLVRARGLEPRQEYHEESGLGFRLGSYWLARGVTLQQPVGESASLLRNYSNFVKPGTVEYELATLADGESRDLIHYMSHRMETSDRRTHAIVAQKGIDGLRERHTSSTPYRLYSNGASTRPAIITPYAEARLQADIIDRAFFRRVRALPDAARQEVHMLFVAMYGCQLSE